MARKPYPLSDHKARRLRAHVAEIAATPDWATYGSGESPETIPAKSFVQRKAAYTARGGRRAPWSGGNSALADRIRREGTVAHAAYYDDDALGDRRS